VKMETLPEDDNIWRVHSLGKILWNYDAPDSPLIECCLEKLGESHEFKIIKVGFFDMVFAPIGSCWQRQEEVDAPLWSHQGISLKNIVIKPSEVSFVSAFGLRQSEPKRYFIPPYQYKLPKEFGSSKFLMCSLQDGSKVFIPSSVIFLRLYGASRTFKKAFLSSDSTHALKAMRYDVDLTKLENQPKEGDYVVGLTMEMLDADCPWVYLLENSPYFQSVHNKVRHQLNRSRKYGGFISFPLCQGGDQAMLVSGMDISTSEYQAFLVFDIKGASLPQTPPFFRDRENTNSVSENAERPEKEATGWPGGKQPENNNESPDETSMDSTKPPSNDRQSKSASTPPFIVLGNQMKMTSAVRRERKTSPGANRDLKEAESHSQADPDDNADSDKGGLFAHTAFRKHDMLIEVWERLNHLKASGEIIEIQSVSIRNGEKALLGEKFHFCELPRQGDWTYHAGDKSKPRFIVILEIQTKEQVVTLFEIEPRINRNGKTSRHQGCVVKGTFSAISFYEIFKHLALSKGVWARIPAGFLGEYRAYSHTSNQGGLVKALKEPK